jgi:hypothetical protein
MAVFDNEYKDKCGKLSNKIIGAAIVYFCGLCGGR